MKGIQRLFAVACLLAAAGVHAQSELQTYVTRCQNELGFTAAEVKPLNCNTGPNFAFGGRTQVNDFVVHARVNANVDMVAACRWGDGTFDGENSTKFVQAEMIMHNRVNGATCFFAAKDSGSDPRKPVSNVLVSPTNFSGIHPNANDFWLTPTQLNSKLLYSNASSDPDFKEQLQCVRCHSQGPYIASERIAPMLANMGLLNDGHHTNSDFAAPNHYYVVGSNAHTDPNSGAHPFKNWNNLIARNNLDPTLACSTGCHARAKINPEPGFTPIGDLTPPNDRNTVVLPSISTDILQLDSCCMPPDNEDAAWRWVNIDQPGSDAAEVETFTASKKIPITGYCGIPGWLEASAVETNTTFSTLAVGFMPNKLRAFNLRDGLTCLNADQPGGARCYDHSVSYRCPGPNDKWTPYYNKDTNISDDGDHEERSRAIADATAFCGGKAPVAMRAQASVNGTMVPANAPVDRLAQFSRSGLVCRNSDQGSGQSCSNYVVRYRGCRDDGTLNKVKSAWTNLPTFGDRYLTTTNNVDGAETRAQAGNFQYPSQDWMIEPVSGGSTVRLADVWSGKYLTASSNADLAAVQVKNTDFSLMRQQWVMETIVGSSEVRFRNVGTGRYLTVGNYTGSDPYFAPILSQSLSNQNWASQRWIVQ